jgi:hypothetical protein
MFKRQRRELLFDRLREDNQVLPLEQYRQQQQQEEEILEEALGVQGTEEDAGEDDDDDGPAYEQCGLETRAREIQELGQPNSRGTCFGCVYIGERDAGAVHEEKLAEIMDLVVKSIGQTDIVCLVNEVYRRYEEIRQETNARLVGNERPLPEWSPGTILEHFRHHHCDPEFHTWMTLRDIREAKEVSINSMVEINKRTKKRRINKDAVRAFSELAKLELMYAKVDPSKFIFYSGGKRLDMKSMSQGPMSTNFKPVVAMLKRGNKR